MIKCSSRICSLILFLSIFSFNIYAQEEDYCAKQEVMYKSTFNGSILYGSYGATSQLDRDENFEKYKPENAFDNDLNTAWVEGKKDDGAGEKISFFTTYSAEKIGVLPGYGTAKHFKLNNRVKSAKLSIFDIEERNANQCLGMFYKKGKLMKTMVLNFEDTMTIQYFTPGVIPESPAGYIYTIEIISVYKGSKYNDTCIAEIVAE